LLSFPPAILAESVLVGDSSKSSRDTALAEELLLPPVNFE